VDAPQLTDSAWVIYARNRLTKNTNSVDSHSFFDISKVFPVGGESGSQAKVTSQRRKLFKRWRAGKGLFSELLVEKNVKCLKAKIEAPRC
jgi:hypothetical protein